MQTLNFDYATVEPQIRAVLYQEIGQHIAVETEEVDGGRVFVKVIAPQFNGLSEQEKQERIWTALRQLGPDAQAVSLALAFGTREI